MLIDFEKMSGLIASKGEVAISFSMLSDKLVVKCAVKEPKDKRLSDDEAKALSPIAMSGTVAEFQGGFEAIITDYLSLGKELVELPDVNRLAAARSSSLKKVVEKRKADLAKEKEKASGNSKDEKSNPAKVGPKQTSADQSSPSLFDMFGAEPGKEAVAGAEGDQEVCGAGCGTEEHEKARPKQEAAGVVV